MVHSYSFPFSLMVVEEFLKRRARGWGAVQKVLDDFYIEDVVEIFQKHPFKWNIFKKLIKHVERVDRPDYLTYDKVVSLWNYFRDFQRREKETSVGLTHSASTL